MARFPNTSLLFLSFFLLFSCAEKKTEHAPKELESTEVSQHFDLPEIPKQVNYCGETVALNNFDIREGLDKELIVNTYYHSSTIQYFKRANRYFPTLERILEEEGVPEDMKYLCLIESGLTQAVSPSGAKGFWQFMPGTAKEYGLKINREVDERLDIEKSTRAACAYLKNAYEEFNDWVLTSAAYNRGLNGIKKDLKQQGVSDYFELYLNNETRRYVFRILALKLIFENPDRYNFNPENIELYDPVEVRKLTITESVDNLMIWSRDHKTTYRMLKRMNPWIISNKLTVKREPFVIKIPVN